VAFVPDWGECKDAREADVLLVDANPYWPSIAAVGLEALATALASAGRRVRVVSASPHRPDYEATWESLRGTAPLLVALQIRNYDAALLVHQYHPTPASFYEGVARRLTALFPAAPLVLGGIGFSIDPQTWLARTGALCGVVGSGEDAIVALASHVLDGAGALTEIPNLVGRGGARGPHEAPAALARVDRRHVDHAELSRRAAGAAGGVPWASVEIARGCRYRCDFCVEPRVHGRTVAFKAPEDVVAELEQLVAVGIHDVFFAASEFNLDLDRALSLCDALIAARLPVRWMTYLIPNRLPPALAARMVAASCRSISFNAVHVDDEILRSFSCPHRRHQYERCLDVARDAGLRVSSTFLVGSALESERSLSTLLDFIDARDLQANLGLGVALYPVLPPGPATRANAATRLFTRAGNGTIPYQLNLTPDQVARVEAFCASRPGVTLATHVPTLSDHVAEDARFTPALTALGGEDRPAADAALAQLRRELPLLDLPEVSLADEEIVPAPAEPTFRLFGPYAALSRFYGELETHLAGAGATPQSVARLLVRLGACAGEFPRIVSFARARGHVDPEAADWLLDDWRGRHAFPQLVLATSYACQSSCPYCYARDVDEQHPGTMSLADFETALAWAARQGCRVISFVGGEPTLHPLMPEFLRRVRERGLRTYFNSNLLCPPALLEPFDPSWVINIGIHAQASRYTPRAERSGLDENVARLRERGVPLFLRYNFTKRTQAEIDDALALAGRYQVPQVNFAVPMPALARSNRFASEAELLGAGDFLVRAVEAFRAAGLRPVLSKPIPPCAVPEDKLPILGAGDALSPACNLPKRGWTQNALVGPDLSISPCVGISSRGPKLTDFEGFDELAAYMRAHLRRIVRSTPFPQCRTCNFHLDRRCLGACLAYFTDGEAPTADEPAEALVTLRRPARVTADGQPPAPRP
jgi:pyruvate-formate lyase-activating enzyme